MIGKLEEVVLLAALRAGPGSLPSAIHERIVATTAGGDKEPAFGAVYTTISRMAVKGMLQESVVTDARGRSRKGFTVSAAGQRALDAALSQTRALGGFAPAEAWT